MTNIGRRLDRIEAAFAPPVTDEVMQTIQRIAVSTWAFTIRATYLRAGASVPRGPFCGGPPLCGCNVAVTSSAPTKRSDAFYPAGALRQS
jgi:hypothetical protein